MKDKILSIQSKLVYGYVGSNVAELAIQLHGLDIIALPTVYLAAHTGHQPVYGAQIDKQLFDDLIKGVENLNILDSTINIVSGYISTEDLIISSGNFIEKIKDQYPDKLYICDPVMGDVGGLYVSEEAANRMITRLLPLCDIMTPNQFEFEYIIGHQARTKEAIIEAISIHPILREKTVVITSCHLEDTSDDELETIIVKNGELKRVAAQKIDIQATGTGDFFTAVLASQMALGKDVVAAVTEAVQVLTIALRYTVDNGNPELNARSLMTSILRDKVG